jgi:hypothetical protein
VDEIEGRRGGKGPVGFDIVYLEAEVGWDPVFIRELLGNVC